MSDLRNPDFIPLAIEEWDQVDMSILLYVGTLTRDFGPWKKDERACLTFDYGRGVVTEYYEDGEIKHECMLALRVEADASPAKETP